jgi:glycosyltransferase involved in cell wall biosynthesis
MNSHNTKKTILFIEQNRDGTVGGSHLCLLQTIRSLNKTAYQAIVMFYQDNSLLETFRKEDCTVLVFDKPVGKKFNTKILFLKSPLFLFQKLYNLLFSVVLPFIRSIFFLLIHRVDLVHLNNCPVAVGDWLLAAKILRKKCITHDRGYAHFNKLTLMLAKKIDKIICMAEWIRVYLNQCGIADHKLEVLYDGIAPEVFNARIKKTPQAIRDEFGITSSTPFIGLVGNIQEWKGQIYAIQAVAILKQKFPDICCLLIGGVSPSGQNMEYQHLLVDEVKKQNLEKNVILTGFRNDIPDLMNAVDIVLHTSINPEPFGMVILEAMSLKKPVIATNFGGPKEIIEDALSGILVPAKDPAALAEKIEMLIINPDLRAQLGENAHFRVKTVFNMEQFTLNLHRIYSGLL